MNNVVMLSYFNGVGGFGLWKTLEEMRRSTYFSTSLSIRDDWC